MRASQENEYKYSIKKYENCNWKYDKECNHITFNSNLRWFKIFCNSLLMYKIQNAVVWTKEIHAY